MVKALNRKPIFDLVRQLLGRGFKKSEVAKLDAAIDAAREGSNLKPTPPTIAEHSEIPSSGSEAAIALIHRFEACAKKTSDGRFKAYPDPGSADGHPWTIGWGSTGRDAFHGGSIRPGTVWTKEQCDQRFEKDLLNFGKQLVELLGDAAANTSQAQFDALLSFLYNLGKGQVRSSTLLRKHKAGDHAGAAREFGRWVFNDGKRMRGLERRRAAEADLYRSGM